jgi:hypothetical protein
MLCDDADEEELSPNVIYASPMGKSVVLVALSVYFRMVRKTAFSSDYMKYFTNEKLFFLSKPVSPYSTTSVCPTNLSNLAMRMSLRTAHLSMTTPSPRDNTP